MDEDTGFLIAAIAFIVFVTTVVAIIVSQPVCYGIEPDGERETITCPAGWQKGETRRIGEDEFEDQEWDD